MPGEIKTVQNAWAVITEFEYLCEADHNARKGKRYRQEVLAFTAAFEHNLFVIQAQMQGGTYILGPYRKLWVFVPKKRLVMALRYPDRIVQWSLYQYLNPIYDKLFIEDSYACRKDKGSHKAAQRLQYWMRQVSRKPDAKWYYLKLDISKFFYRVNHAKLLEILSRRIKDPELMRFLDSVINSRAEAFGLPRGKTPQDTPPEEWLYDVGMPIGNLTSQLFANIYMKLRKSTVGRLKREVKKITEMYATGEMSKEDFDRRVASIKGLLAHTQSASLRGRLNLIYRDTMQKYGRPTGPETDIWKGTYEEKKLARSVRKAA